MTDEEEKIIPDELEVARMEMKGLKREKEALSAELETKDRRITELEQALAGRDGEIFNLKQSLDETDGRLAVVNDGLTQAVAASYRTAVMEANPAIPEELIGGDAVEAIDQSMEKARSIVAKVKQELEEEASRSRVPAGAPPRTLPDLSALSSWEKIQYAIGGRR